MTYACHREHVETRAPGVFLHEFLSVVNQGADGFSVHHLFQVAHDVHVEDVDRKVVFLAHGSGSKVHDL